jgi:hypothetical protein
VRKVQLVNWSYILLEKYAPFFFVKV